MIQLLCMLAFVAVVVLVWRRSDRRTQVHLKKLDEAIGQATQVSVNRRSRQLSTIPHRATTRPAGLRR